MWWATFAPKEEAACEQLTAFSVSFIKASERLDPVQLVHSMCVDAQSNPEEKRSRWIKRMTPMTQMGKSLGPGLEDLSRRVLKPHFRSGVPKKVSSSATVAGSISRGD